MTYYVPLESDKSETVYSLGYKNPALGVQRLLKLPSSPNFTCRNFKKSKINTQYEA
jgi:hypothetical protein